MAATGKTPILLYGSTTASNGYPEETEYSLTCTITYSI